MESFDTQYARRRPDFVTVSAIHPDDQSDVEKTPLPVLTLYELHGSKDDYTFARRTCAEKPFRILTAALLPIPAPRFGLGQQVLSLISDPPNTVAVYRIEWHLERAREVYFVIRDGKLSTRRYLPDQLSAIE